MVLPMRSAFNNRIKSSTPVTVTPSAHTMVSKLIKPANAAGPEVDGADGKGDGLVEGAHATDVGGEPDGDRGKRAAHKQAPAE